MRTPNYRAPREKQIRLCLPTELFERFKIAAAMEGVAYSYKAFLVICQYLEDHKQQIDEYSAFMEEFNKKNAATSTRKPILTNSKE